MVEAQKSPKPTLLLERHSCLLILKEYTYYLLMDCFLVKLIMKHACFSFNLVKSWNIIRHPSTAETLFHNQGPSTLGLNLVCGRFFTQEKSPCSLRSKIVFSCVVIEFTSTRGNHVGSSDFWLYLRYSFSGSRDERIGAVDR